MNFDVFVQSRFCMDEIFQICGAYMSGWTFVVLCVLWFYEIAQLLSASLASTVHLFLQWFSCSPIGPGEARLVFFFFVECFRTRSCIQSNNNSRITFHYIKFRAIGEGFRTNARYEFIRSKITIINGTKHIQLGLILTYLETNPWGLQDCYFLVSKVYQALLLREYRRKTQRAKRTLEVG